MSNQKHQKLIVILGPTASGKTDLSLDLAKKFNGYIISADSRQIYQNLDLGTGKLTNGTWKKVKNKRILHFENIPHYMIDIINPRQEYTVAQYQKAVYKIIKENSNQIPFLVGGTGLYIDAVINGLNIPQVPPDKKLRQELNKKTNKELLSKLKKIDPDTANKIDTQNKRRLIRALEVSLKSSKPFSSFQTKKPPNFDVLQIGLKLNRKELNQRINKRVDKMIKQGLVKEVQKLISQKNNKNRDLPAFSGLGYKQIIMHLNGELSLEEAQDLIKLRTRQFAKRQMTWFKRDKRIKWIPVGARRNAPAKQTRKLVEKILE